MTEENLLSSQKNIILKIMHLTVPKHTISHAELSLFAVFLNYSLITVDCLQTVQQNDGRKSKGFPFFSNKYNGGHCVGDWVQPHHRDNVTSRLYLYYIQLANRGNHCAEFGLGQEVNCRLFLHLCV